ncbi:MAG: hypothetical protein ABIJ97_03620 [Bacteroidota bacterium]
MASCSDGLIRWIINPAIKHRFKQICVKSKPLCYISNMISTNYFNEIKLSGIIFTFIKLFQGNFVLIIAYICNITIMHFWLLFIMFFYFSSYLYTQDDFILAGDTNNLLYHDINDTTLCCYMYSPAHYSLDMNDDSIPDISFSSNKYIGMTYETRFCGVYTYNNLLCVENDSCNPKKLTELSVNWLYCIFNTIYNHIPIQR